MVLFLGIIARFAEFARGHWPGRAYHAGSMSFEALLDLVIAHVLMILAIAAAMCGLAVMFAVLLKGLL